MTHLTGGKVMKGFNFFKNYPTKTEFNAETQEFEERPVQWVGFEDSDQAATIDPRAPLALTYVMFGLRKPAKRRQKF